MVRRLRTSLLALLLIAVAGALIAACGGDDEAASQDVDTLLRETFSGDKKIESGALDLAVEVDARGSRQVSGPVNLSLSGPFESTGDGKLPKFRLTLGFSGAGQDIRAGATSTGDKGYVAFQNREYVVAPQVFRQFKASFEEAQAKQGAGKDQSLATLGINPTAWLREPRNEGEAKVGDEDTIKITGAVDVPKLLDDVEQALQRAGSLGGGTGRGLPQRLTDAQRREVQDAVEALDVEIYTGAEDKILRRMLIEMDLQAPAGDDRGFEYAKIRFDLSITGVNEDQDIEEPDNARPFRELTNRLGALGLGGSGAGSTGSSSGGTSSRALERYSDCIRAAGSDAGKAQKCADLLTP